MWVKVTKPEELKIGEMVRYSRGYFNAGYHERDKRIVSSLTPFGIVDTLGNFREAEFDFWDTFEVWRNDDTPTTAPTPKPAPSRPIHRGYEWDGVVYQVGMIGDKTLKDHFENVRKLREQLAVLNKQTARYKVLEKRGLQ